MTLLKSKVRNTSKYARYTRCKQTAFKRAVLPMLLELSQQSTSPLLYVSICHNMSRYRRYVTIIQPAFSLTSGLYCKRKSIVWKTFLAKELMMQRGSWAPQEILIPGMSFIFTSLDIPAKCGKTMHSILIVTILLMCKYF